MTMHVFWTIIACDCSTLVTQQMVKFSLLQKLCSAVHHEIGGHSGALSHIANGWHCKQQHRSAGSRSSSSELRDWAIASGLSAYEQLPADSSNHWQPYSSDSTSSSSNAQPRGAMQPRQPGISASCDVAPDHGLHRKRMQYATSEGGAAFSSSTGSGSSTGSYHSPFKLPPQIQEGTVGTISPDEFIEMEQVLSCFYEEGLHGGLGRRFRRKVPLFQVRACVVQRWGLSAS